MAVVDDLGEEGFSVAASIKLVRRPGRERGSEEADRETGGKTGRGRRPGEGSTQVGTGEWR